MDSYVSFPWFLEERVLFDYEILYLKEGRLKVTVEDDVYFGKKIVPMLKFLLVHLKI
jgi:hypothetical protein